MELKLAEIAGNPEWKQMLINIVKKEDMNPWDIDIGVLTSDYLKELKKIKTHNLRIPATALLVSSILLRYKSDAWVFNEDNEDPIFYIPDALYVEPEFPELEPIIRTTTRHVSLDELINAIEDVMVKEKKKENRPKRIIEKIIPDVLIELVEEREDFQELVNKVYTRVQGSVDENKLTLLSNLIKKKSKQDFIDTFVPILFLATQRKIDIWQEKVFDDVFIQLLDGEVA